MARPSLKKGFSCCISNRFCKSMLGFKWTGGFDESSP